MKKTSGKQGQKCKPKRTTVDLERINKESNTLNKNMKKMKY